MRIKELDAFRGIAAFAVMIYHFTTIYGRIFTSTSTAFSFDYGWLGVPFFFILSGFVITLTVEKCKSSKEFLLKRFLRLYPTYWICLTITVAVIFLGDLGVKYETFDKSVSEVLMNYTMFHKYFNFDNVDGAYWSLLPELLFYILMAGLLAIGKHKQLILYNSILILICSIHYFLPLPIIGKTLAVHYILLFMIGINFYKIYTKEANSYNHILVIINLIIGVFLYQIERHEHNIFFVGISFTLIVSLFYLFVYNKMIFFGRITPLVFLGTISYALYLIHQNVGYVIMIFLDKHILSREVNVLLASVCSILLASIITFSVEPLLRSRVEKILKIN